MTSLAAAPNGGFWSQIQDSYADWTPTPPGHTQLHDGAPAYENILRGGLIAWAPGTNGYWVVTESGHIYSRGGAKQLCPADSLETCSGFVASPLSNLISVAATPTGNGLWALARNGKVWTAGDAISYGDATFDKESIPTAIAPTPDGGGYYIVMKNGGVHTFGNAIFYDSTGGNPPGGVPITGIATSIDSTGKVNGYWLVGRDGGVHPFGSAPFWGSSGGNDSVVTNIISFSSPSPSTNPETVGYAWINGAGQLSMCTRDRPCGGTAPAHRR